MSLSDKAKAFLAKDPVIIGNVGGVDYYESPVHGDEVPLLIIVDGKVRSSGFYELPSLEEHKDMIEYEPWFDLH